MISGVQDRANSALSRWCRLPSSRTMCAFGSMNSQHGLTLGVFVHRTETKTTAPTASFVAGKLLSPPQAKKEYAFWLPDDESHPSEASARAGINLLGAEADDYEEFSFLVHNTHVSAALGIVQGRRLVTRPVSDCSVVGIPSHPAHNLRGVWLAPGLLCER